ncbi:hypothetical protein BDV12DRAFT_26211 [Aspergillus spectabilis]
MKFAFIEATRTMTNVTTLPFFFNARGNTLEKTVLEMYRSLLCQLLEKMLDLQGFLDTLSVEVDHGHGPEWGLENLKDLLHTAAERLRDRPVVCYIDALDECDESWYWRIRTVIIKTLPTMFIGAENRTQQPGPTNQRHYHRSVVWNFLTGCTRRTY